MLEILKLQERAREKLGERNLAPDLHYLWELGYVSLSFDRHDALESARLTAAGIDLYEQLVLRKWGL